MIVEVMNSLVGPGLLKRANKQFGLFQNSEFISIELFLERGDISEVDKLKTRKVYGFDIEMKESVTNFLNLAEQYKKVRIWSSRSHTSDYLFFLFVLNLLKEKDIQISVVFTDDFIVSYEDGEKISPYSLECCTEEEIEKILEYQRTVTKEEMSKHLNEWEILKRENAPLRVIQDEKVKSVPEDYFDEVILRTLKELGATQVIKLIGAIRGINYKILGELDYYFFTERIKRLIEIKKIIIIEDENSSKLKKENADYDELFSSIKIKTK